MTVTETEKPQLK